MKFYRPNIHVSFQLEEGLNTDVIRKPRRANIVTHAINRFGTGQAMLVAAALSKQSPLPPRLPSVHLSSRPRGPAGLV